MNGYLAYILPVGGGGHIDNSLPSGGGHPSQPIYHPGHPDHGLPAQPGHPSTGPIYGGGHPSTGPIYGGGHPSGQPVPPQPTPYMAVPEDELPEHPTAPDPHNGEWVLVDVNGEIGWAWLDQSQAAPK